MRLVSAALVVLLFIAVLVFGDGEEGRYDQQTSEPQHVDRVVLVSVDETSRARTKLSLDSAFKLATKIGKGRTSITGLLPNIVEAQLGESEGNTVVIKACDQVTMKLRQEQSSADDSIKSTTTDCAINLDTLRKTLVDQQGQHDQAAERITAAQATIGTAVRCLYIESCHCNDCLGSAVERGEGVSATDSGIGGIECKTSSSAAAGYGGL